MSKFNGLLFLYSLSIVITSALTVTSFCEVPEHNLSLVYNLTKLSSNKDIIIKHDHPINETIRMQLCSPLVKKCNNQDGYAICLIKDNIEKGIGRYPPEVDNKDGRILFNFTGDNCLHNVKYTVQIIMQCDYSVENNSYPELFPHADKQCNLFMLWKTALACGPTFQTHCTVVNNGSNYDLSPLTRFSDNYVIHISEMKSPKIVLNICHSIIRQYGAMCPIKTGACLNDPEKPNRYSSLGEVRKPPFFKNGYLQIEYEDGTLCYENIKSTHIKTTIRFICRLEATETIPEYVGGRNDCHYQLVWYTAAACSIESLRNYSIKTAGICSVTNPITNFTYNLQPLMNKDFIVQNASSIKLRVCGMLTDSTCKTGTGICKYNISLGQADTNLKWQQDGPYLKYLNGNLCENGMYHYTIIKFFCSSGLSNQPMLVKEYPCQTIIHWNTDLVCEKRIKCTTNNDNEINLTPLIQSTNNYIVKANGTEFHINICRPLVSTRQSLSCPYGSAACKVSVTSKNEYTNEISLGFPEDSPTLNKDLQTVLRYIGGSQCPEDPATLISSNFTFVCDNNNQGLPVFKTYVNCTYVFEWHTSIACGAVIGVWTPPCFIKDSFLSYEYDLSLLHKKEQIHNVKGKQGKEYSINICGGEKYCSGSAVCHEGNGYGSLKSVIFDYSRDDVKLKYSNGDKCNNNSYTSEVRFLCNDSIGIGTPKLLLESQCSAEFEWHTEVICAKHANSQDLDREKISSGILLVSSSHGKHAGAIAGIVLTVIAVTAALIYFRKPEKRACFRSWINLFSFRRNEGRVQYCKVNTTEEAKLLFGASDPTQYQTDSDDDLLHA